MHERDRNATWTRLPAALLWNSQLLYFCVPPDEKVVNIFFTKMLDQHENISVDIANIIYEN